MNDDLNLGGFIPERSLVHVARFVDGFAAGWFFAVPECFKEALDIKPTVRRRDGVDVLVLTQGPYYAFKRGDIIHGSRAAYNEPWGRAFGSLRYSLAVKQASPVSEVISMEYRTASAVSIISNSGGTLEQRDSRLTYQRSRLDYGLVRFAVMVPNHVTFQLEETVTIERDQEEFVAFLQTGVLRDGDMRELDFRSGLPSCFSCGAAHPQVA